MNEKEKSSQQENTGFASKIKQLYTKYKEFINYIIVGGFTTLVRWGTAVLLETVLYPIGFRDTALSIFTTLLSLIITILFAFPPNKLFVFNSKSFKKEIVGKEFVAFISARAAASLIELVGIPLIVKITNIENIIATMAVSVIVLFANYIFSKLVVFKKRKVSDSKGGKHKKEDDTEIKATAKDKLIATVLTVICVVIVIISVIFYGIKIIETVFPNLI